MEISYCASARTVINSKCKFYKIYFCIIKPLEWKYSLKLFYETFLEAHMKYKDHIKHRIFQNNTKTYIYNNKFSQTYSIPHRTLRTKNIWLPKTSQHNVITNRISNVIEPLRLAAISLFKASKTKWPRQSEMELIKIYVFVSSDIQVRNEKWRLKLWRHA